MMCLLWQLATVVKSLAKLLRAYKAGNFLVLQEIGLDELRDAARPVPRPYTPPATNTAAAAGAEWVALQGMLGTLC
jgi:hypothetical protein